MTKLVLSLAGDPSLNRNPFNFQVMEYESI